MASAAGLNGAADANGSAAVDVVVSGAGAGGLAAARALGALGLSVLVLDRRRTPTPVAKGEILQPETIRILDSWGALDALLATGARPVSRLAIRDPEGQPLLSLDYGILPGPYRQVMCADYSSLQSALAEGLAPTVEIRRGVRVEDVLRDGGGRVVGVRTAGEGSEIRAALVVAADGMSSPLRRAVGVEAERKEYSHRLLAFDVADVEVEDELSAYRTSRGLCLVYPLPDNRCRLYVQVAPDEFRTDGTADLTAWFDGVLADVPAIRPLEKAVRASLHARQLLAVYRLRARRLSVPGLAFVGEAAHAVHPMAAQGVNSSLADAETLASLLRPLLTAEPSLDAAGVDRALVAYDESRGPRIDHIAIVSHNASRMITSVSGLPKMLGTRMMRRTAANPRLLGLTAGNLSGTNVRPLSFVDRLYQLGLLVDRHAHTPLPETAPDSNPDPDPDLSEAAR